MSTWTLLLCCAVMTVGFSSTSPDKKSLTRFLLRSEMASVPPRIKRSSSILVDMKIPRIQAHFDETSKHLKLTTEYTLTWSDVRLKWNPSDYSGIKEITEMDLDAERVWHPLIYIFCNYQTLLRCTQFQILNSGKVTCHSTVETEHTCRNKNTDDLLPNSFYCYLSYFTWKRVNLTCDGKWEGCYRKNTFDRDGIWNYGVGLGKVNHYKIRGAEEYTFKNARFTLTRIQPRSSIIFAPAILLGCMVLFQWLLMFNYQEKMFLNAALLLASISVVTAVHSIPAVQNGEGGKLLRLSCAVVLLNGVVMLVTTLSTNILYTITARFDVNSAISNWLQRFKLTIFLPTLVKFPGGDSDKWLSLNITLDRLFFLISALVFIIIASVP